MDTKKAPKSHSLILAARTKWCDLNLIRQIAYSRNGMWKKIIMHKTGGEQRRERKDGGLLLNCIWLEVTGTRDFDIHTDIKQ